MKVTLRLQFITAYLLLVICIFALINTYGYSLTYNYLETKKEQQISSEAYYLTSHYASTQGTPEDGAFTLQKQSTMLSSLFDTRVWLVSPTGTILSDSSDYDYVGKNITDSDSDFLNRQSVKGARPKGIMKSNVLAVICPLTGSKETKGYLVLLTPQKAIKEEATLILDTILICYLLLLLVSAIVFLLLYWRSVYPLKQLAHNAKEYADGHFDQKPAKLGGAEQLELASAVKYLAQKNKSMIEYQRQFLANVSHDFRSPLTSIRGYTEALADGTIPPEMQEKYLHIILHNTLKETIETFEPQCEKKHLSIDLLLDGKELYVKADQSKIQRVIQNLVDNAIKFSNINSVIEIHTVKKHHKVFVSVKDHGIGITKEEASKIWDRFYKSDRSRGKDKTGTGLGLSITKEIIEAHGEHINVISTEGVGTEFIFSLPLDEE